MGNHQAKELLVDDGSYSKPSDHYFTYLNTIKKEDEESHRLREKSILSGLPHMDKDLVDPLVRVMNKEESAEAKMSEEQREMTMDLKQAALKRDFMLKKFDVTPDEVLEGAAQRHGFKNKSEMRKQMEKKLKVPEDPYKAVKFTK